ncbi:cell wall-active antibiotics response protein LiaF [Lentibacillus saliphilus]|uniref:cell wall-active antibiotics response protein LiaF n=1 Tax=Lentibacillus saliphilus TaxID=2737028 RepID=UPI001C305B0C|nr:cell wall-active antibiotics response protein LiaF [Lentibacillus saliphilus]
MMQRLTTDTFNWILIVGVILFIVEIAFFHGGMIGTALFAALFIYIGRKNYSQLWGKIMFWLGVVGLLLSILNMLAVRFFIIAAIVIFVIQYSKSQKEADHTAPHLPGSQDDIFDPVVKITPLFNHTLYEDQKTVDMSYQWKDVNIHGGVGNRVIDLSNTVLPNDTAIISIRHFVGNIAVHIPYDVDVSVHHSAVFGRAFILGKDHIRLMNQSLHYQTESYDTATTRVKIVTSVFSGDIEVKRI